MNADDIRSDDELFWEWLLEYAAEERAYRETDEFSAERGPPGRRSA